MNRIKWILSSFHIGEKSFIFNPWELPATSISFHYLGKKQVTEPSQERIKYFLKNLPQERERLKTVIDKKEKVYQRRLEEEKKEEESKQLPYQSRSVA